MNPPSKSDFLTPTLGFLIVGLGASAGGIQALRVFFEHVPADSNMAYVVILHLSPDHDSQLAQVLRTVSAIPVSQVTERVTIEPNRIYVVSPNHHLTMEGDAVVPSLNQRVEDRRAPVDILFRSLADAHGPRAVSVVLSGTGANGSMGLKRVKEMGGVTYVQNPREAEFNEMPRNAIATELIDQVLPVAQIPGRILAYRDSLGTVKIPVEAENRPEQQQQALREIFTHLRVRTGHDFSNYKRATLLRRIERRLNVRGLPDLPAYAAYLLQNADESQGLLKDLLISVTNFFRDKKPFVALEQDVLPAIFYNKKSDSEVRIWVAGCATGEEAYSLAMLLAERTWGVLDAPRVQIFATDIDETAIMTAREGLYTLNDAADVSPERLQRFFIKEGDQYRMHREIREMILFANHNFLRDPPFSRLDLVSCRNVLIYLNSTAQERVMETFHFALKPGGYLFLGSAESVDSASDLYATLNRDNHLYQVRGTSSPKFPVPESVPSLLPRQPLPGPRKLADAGAPPLATRSSFGELHQALLEQYAPPSLVVNEAYDIVHLSEKAGRFLEFSGGEPTKNLLKLVQPELRLELRSALYQAVQRQTALEARNIAWTRNGERQSVTIHVRPVLKEGDTAKGFVLVIFEPGELAPEQEEQPAVFTSNEPVAKQLEEELIQVKGQLRYSAEQFEYQAEELKASNEELQAMNEELRSAAEELETSKEELQSINEELRTVNQELKVKIEEISLTSNNFQNLINSAGVATIFLDRTFCIRLYTPAALQLFNLIPSDYGRPVSDITHRLADDQLLADAQTVLEKLTLLERELSTTDDRTFMMRVLPYRTIEDRINGVVITFFDITERKRAELALRNNQQQQQFLLQLSDALRPLADAKEIQRTAMHVVGEHFGLDRAMYAEVTPDGKTLLVSDNYLSGRFPAFTGSFPLSAYGTIIEKARHGEPLIVADVAEEPDLTDAEKSNYQVIGSTAFVVLPLHKGGQWVANLVVHQGVPRRWAPEEVAVLQETAERTWAAVERARAEQALHDFSGQLEHQVRERTAELHQSTQSLQRNLAKLHQAEEAAKMGSWEYDIASGTMSWSDGLYRLFGLPVGSPTNPGVYLEYAVEEDQALVQQLLRLREQHEPLDEILRLRLGGEVRIFRIKSVVLRNEQGEPVKLMGIDLDISEVKRLEEEKLQMRLDQQKALLLGILDAQEEERRRLAESLHNGVGQLLYATKLSLERVAQGMPPEIIRGTEQLLAEAIRETRRVSHELVPIFLADFGLAKSLAEMCTKYRQVSFQVGCEVVGLENRLESYLEVALYRICQELVTNVVKHAGATRADILLVQEDGEITLKLRDDGKGFEPEPNKQNGIGLRTIRDRVHLLNGTFSIQPNPAGKGTQATIQLPGAELK